MRRPIASLLLAATVSTLTACGTSDRPSATGDGPVVARYDDGTVTAEEVDARILALPASERPRPGEDLDTWTTELVREMVVERRLLAAARAEDLAATPAFATARRDATQQIGLELCLAALSPQAEAISEEDLQAAFAESAQELSAPERRAVYQIFLRREPGARARIEELRDRVLAGEGFPRLAEELSESETRHRKGFVGWVYPGRLPEGFERVIFELEEGVPSEPVATRAGFHLFYVDQILPARHLDFQEARPILAERLAGARREEVLAALDADTSPPADSLILDREQLARVVQAGDPAAPVLRLGELSWTLGDLRQRVQAFMAQEGTPGGAPTLELAWRILDQARRGEEIRLHCRAEGLVDADRLELRLGAWQERALVESARHRRLVELARRDPDRLHLFYESNLGDFSAPPTWTVEILRVPLGERPAATMERLERAAAADDGPDLDALRSELGGEIETLEPMSLPELGRLQPKLPGLVAPLAPGELAAPYRTAAGLEIAQVTARREAEPLPFDQVRERVAARYVGQYTAELYDTLAAEMLRAAELEIDPAALAALREAGLPERDVSVDELDALLDQL